MPNTNIYLHEIIHIVGAGSEPYKQHTGEGWSGRWREGSSQLVGLWQQSGSTGDWPKVVNLWEMAGYDQWAEILERQYSGEGQPPGLREWWAQALSWRSGGHDRILEAAPWSPTRAELIARRIGGRAFIQEVAAIVPGEVDAYLDAVRSRWVPVAKKRGLDLFGAYRVSMRDDEAVLLWCLPTLRAYTDHLKTFPTDRATRAWAEGARTWRTSYRETLLIPSRWVVTHPDWKPAAGEGVQAPAARPGRRYAAGTGRGRPTRTSRAHSRSR